MREVAMERIKCAQQWPTSRWGKPLCAGCLGRAPQAGDYCLECYEVRVMAPGAGGVGGN